jgi:hypothetical protein
LTKCDPATNFGERFGEDRWSMRFDNLNDLMHRKARTDSEPKEINQLRNTLAARALDRQLL